MVKKRRPWLLALITAVGLIIFFMASTFYVNYNLGKNSIYYASHLKHKEGTDPVMVAVLNDLGNYYIPGIDESTRTEVPVLLGSKSFVSSQDKKRYYTVPQSGVGYSNDGKEWMELLPVNSGGIEIVVSNYGSTRDVYAERDVGIFFDTKGGYQKAEQSLYDSSNGGVLSKNDITVSEKEIENYKNDLYGNIVKSQKRPLLNLQFLYNWMNESKFN